MPQIFTNNAFSTLATQASSGASQLTLASGDGEKFPSPGVNDFFEVTLTQAGEEVSWEIARCTSRSGDSLELQSVLTNTWVAGSKVELRISAEFLNGVESALAGKAEAESPVFSGTLTHTGKTVLNNSSASSVDDYAFDIKQSGTVINAGRSVFSQNSTYGFAVSVNSSGTPSAFVDLQWLTRATGLTQSTPLRLRYNGSIELPTLGARITGDFSTSTIANRVMFQTSTANGVTSVEAIPNGTGTTANLIATNSSDPANSSFISLQSVATEVRVRSDARGTGTYLPLTLYTGGAERMKIDASGNVGIGTAGSTLNHKSVIYAAGATAVYQQIANGVTGLNTANGLRVGLDSAGVAEIISEGSLKLYGGNVARVQIDTSGNVGIGNNPSANTRFSSYAAAGNTPLYAVGAGGSIIVDYLGGSVNYLNGATTAFRNAAGTTNTFEITQGSGVFVTEAVGLGYGTGAGGTVTQSTSKSTAVTLNKPFGQITMNSADLAAGATATFTVNNSLVSLNDVVQACVTSNGNHIVSVQYVTTGLFVLRVTNITAGSLSEAVAINFTVIKGATA